MILVFILVVIIAVLVWFIFDKPGYDAIRPLINHFKIRDSRPNNEDDWNIDSKFSDNLSQRRKNDEVSVLKTRIRDLEYDLRQQASTIDNIKERHKVEIGAKEHFIKEQEDIIKDLSRLNSEKEQELINIRSILGCLYPVSKDNISRPYLDYITKIEAIINSTISDYVQILESNKDAGKASIELAKVLQEKYTLVDNNTILLTTISCVQNETAFDLKNKKDDAAKLDYLEKRILRYHFRPIVSSLILCLEKYRSNNGDDSDMCNLLISRFISQLSELGIYVEYYKIGNILSEDDYKKIQIEQISESRLIDYKENEIINIRKYGVNFSVAPEDIEKTILEVNI